jgi:hypothetical protein
MLGGSDVSLQQTLTVIVLAGVLLFAWCLWLLQRGTGMRT